MKTVLMLQFLVLLSVYDFNTSKLYFSITSCTVCVNERARCYHRVVLFRNHPTLSKLGGIVARGDFYRVVALSQPSFCRFSNSIFLLGFHVSFVSFVSLLITSLQLRPSPSSSLVVSRSRSGTSQKTLFVGFVVSCCLGTFASLRFRFAWVHCSLLTFFGRLLSAAGGGAGGISGLGCVACHRRLS